MDAPKASKAPNVTKAYHKLLVWQRAHQFALAVYAAVKKFPREEQFGLTSQLKRSVISVPANIAEGYVKGSKKDFCRFLFISQGSLAESEYYLELARDLQYLDEKVYAPLDLLRGEVSFLLDRLIRSLR